MLNDILGISRPKCLYFSDDGVKHEVNGFLVELLNYLIDENSVNESTHVTDTLKHGVQQVSGVNTRITKINK